MAGPFTVLVTLLAMAGTLKVADPRPTGAALADAGLPSHLLWVRTLGVFELAVAAAALSFGGWAPAAVIAVTYLGFATFVGRSLRTGATTSCGCFGRSEAPMTWHHVAYNVAAAGAAVAAAVTGVGPLSTTLADQPGAGIPFLALTAVATYLSVLVLTVLPATRAAADPSSHRPVPSFTLADKR